MVIMIILIVVAIGMVAIRIWNAHSDWKKATNISRDYYESDDFEKERMLEYRVAKNMAELERRYRKSSIDEQIIETKRGRNLYAIQSKAWITFVERIKFLYFIVQFKPFHLIKLKNQTGFLISILSRTEDPDLIRRITKLLLK